MTGCRYGAKNTLVKNYLGLAESAGAQVHPMTTVTGFKQRSDGLWEVETAHTGGCCAASAAPSPPVTSSSPPARSARRSCCSRCATRGKLPKLSDKLGVLTRTNSESIVGAGRLEVRDDLDLTHGVAITSSIHPTSDTHVEPVPLRQGLQRDGPAADVDDRRRRARRQRRAALAAAARTGRRRPEEHAADAQPARAGASGR